MKLPVEWSGFYVTNALVVVLGAVQAELAATWLLAALLCRADDHQRGGLPRAAVRAQRWPVLPAS
ncbi:hypothetical protein [Bradyrhizobium sp. STM 3809]|uniref:hypothetical protein n=1 Tax=Bradyrhizobium sp. STM 3809 TaxID=551936 RepID=UPI0002408229|nr:hypothetical protein [Bradyrhizobium sp. STM 3809]CCE03253.1 hypothetical protein BRAS3809_7120008 [Bradyrhizobium sp. STM 3809]